jgi:nicotinate-nucleotide adenylyltransferase
MLYNLVGLDSFLTLPRWHQPDRLLALAEWIVVSRPGYTLDLAAYTLEQRVRIHPLHTVHDDLSATTLRARLAQGDPCPDLIPPAVAAYIKTHALYRTRDDAEA